MRWTGGVEKWCKQIATQKYWAEKYPNIQKMYTKYTFDEKLDNWITTLKSPVKEEDPNLTSVDESESSFDNLIDIKNHLDKRLNKGIITDEGKKALDVIKIVLDNRNKVSRDNNSSLEADRPVKESSFDSDSESDSTVGNSDRNE